MASLQLHRLLLPAPSTPASVIHPLAPIVNTAYATEPPAGSAPGIVGLTGLETTVSDSAAFHGVMDQSGGAQACPSLFSHDCIYLSHGIFILLF